jgi:CRP/FNR family transcriptional regulator, cyclic AMP receptor protein
MKKINMPSSFVDYNSAWNPLLEAFCPKIMVSHDNHHALRSLSKVGLHHQKIDGMIRQDVLMKYGAKEIKLKKDDVLFREGDEALNYFQTAEGSIKMVTNSEDGHEFIQGIFKAGDSFGEPALFCAFPYPSSAIALDDTIIIRLGKEKFLTLLKENFEIHLHLDQILCQRLRYKSMILSEISLSDPEHRISSLLNYLKEDSIKHTADKNRLSGADSSFLVPFTRQQIADMSGLRVETVIRTVKKMESDGKLQLEGRKIKL